MNNIKFIITISCALLIGTTVHSQTVYEGDLLNKRDLNGTARFVGMGGAMGALGGDISTMGTNPAGIGIYRSSDLMLSFGFQNVGMKSNLGGSKMESDNFFGSFDNIGFVLSNRVGNQTSLRFVNFGFNYRKVRSFDRNTSVAGSYGVSQTEQIARMANGNSNYYGEYLDPEFLHGQNSGAFLDETLPWLPILAYRSYLINPNKDGDYESYNFSDDVINGEYNSEERGGIHSYDFNVAFNFNDRFYLGATVGVYDVDYRRYSYYSETFYTGNSNEGNYALTNDYRIDGTGYDFKLGLIVRPFESSPLRIGAAIHTPTFYSLSERNFAKLDARVYDDAGEWANIHEFTQDRRGSEMDGLTDYKVNSPWKYNFSLGYTVGSSVALGAEYEYTDYSATKFKYDDGVKNDFLNGEAKNHLKGVSAIRLGAEIKLAPEFSFRLGYNHITPSINKYAYKDLPVTSIRTDTEFANSMAVNNYTLGLGYRGEHFYADFAYQYHNYKENFYAFDDTESILPATEITNNKHKLLLTLGFRF